MAEKFLPNADRGPDESTQSRDLIDLAFLAARYADRALQPGLLLAESAYGSAIRHYFERGLDRFAADSRYASRCARSLGINDLATLRKGISSLRKLAGRMNTLG